MRKNLGKRLGIFSLALLVVYNAYKGGFGAIPRKNKEGKTLVIYQPLSFTQMHSVLLLFRHRIISFSVILLGN